MNQINKKPKISKKELTISNKLISQNSDCFVIAEIGHNHQGSVEICKQMFKAAKECGVDAVKLQKRHNKHLYTRKYYETPYNSENAFGKTYGLHREALEFDKKQYQELIDYARHLGLIFFATPFDHKSVDFLEDLDMPVYKVASGDLTNIPLLKYVSETGKPILLSTGGGTLADVKRASATILNKHNNLAILQCTASYPSDFSELDLSVISLYHKEFPDNIIGFSAHDNGIAMSVAAFVLGARIIEKHFTLNRVMKGTDHAFSIEPVGLRKLVRDLRRVRLALGDGQKKFYQSEKNAVYKMGKHVVAARSLAVGKILKNSDLAYKSPADGLQPYYAHKFIGKKLKVSLTKDSPLKLEYV